MAEIKPTSISVAVKLAGLLDDNLTLLAADKNGDLWRYAIDPILPPLLWGPSTAAGTKNVTYLRNVAMSGDNVLIAGYNNSTGADSLWSSDGGATLNYTDISASVTANYVAINEDAGVYMVAGQDKRVYTASAIGGSYTDEGTAFTAGIMRMDIANTGDILGVTTASAWYVTRVGGVWTERSHAMIHSQGSVTNIRGTDEWVVVFSGGYATYFNGDLSAPVELVKGLNSGSTVINFRGVSSNSSGLVVAVADSGYASYSIDFGRAGSWLPLPMWLGQTDNGQQFSSVEVAETGYIVVGSANGQASCSHADNIGVWTELVTDLESGAVGEKITGLASNDSGKFISAHYGTDGNIAVSVI